MEDDKYFTLNDGNRIPSVGFGTFQIPADGSTYKAVRQALDAGIRHIDTAVAYFNEKEVGQAVKDSGIPRDEVWITSKLWLQDHDYDAALMSLDKTLKRLQSDYVDLYLVHQPYFDVPAAWKALEKAKSEGKVRSIGVSNMTPKIWNKFVPSFDTVPSVNQIEYNPFAQQREIRAIMAKAGVRTESWGPLGKGNRELLGNPVVGKLAEKYGKDAGQIILRFENQEGVIVFPKSVRPERIRSNADIFGFRLTDDEMESMRALDRNAPSHDPDATGMGEMLVKAFDVHKS